MTEDRQEGISKAGGFLDSYLRHGCIVQPMMRREKGWKAIRPESRLPDQRIIALVKRVKARMATLEDENELAWEIFCRSYRHASKTHRLESGKVRPGQKPEDSEEVAQETVIRVLKAVRKEESS